MIDMNTPDWKDAPEWANWLAMDMDGAWYWYETQPVPRSEIFHNKGNGKVTLAISPKWKDTLQQRPTQ